MPCVLSCSSCSPTCMAKPDTVINIKGESYRLKERKEFMRQKQQIVNTLFDQGNA